MKLEAGLQSGCNILLDHAQNAGVAALTHVVAKGLVDDEQSLSVGSGDVLLDGLTLILAASRSILGRRTGLDSR